MGITIDDDWHGTLLPRIEETTRDDEARSYPNLYSPSTLVARQHLRGKVALSEIGLLAEIIPARAGLQTDNRPLVAGSQVSGPYDEGVRRLETGC